MTTRTMPKLKSILGSIGGPIRRIPRGSIIAAFALISIVTVAVLDRILPLRWGFFLSEFDPYFQYQVADHIATNGYGSWFSMHVDKSWYPWGRDIATTSFPGLPFSAAFVYNLVRIAGLEVSVLDVCIVFPVLMGGVTTLAMYFLGSQVGGRKVGLLSSLFLALSSPYIARTSLGFFDDETIGIFSLVLMSLFYLKALGNKTGEIKSGLFGVVAGLALGYMNASWGAGRYAYGLISLFTFVLLLLNRYNPKILISYTLMVTVGSIISVNVPKLGIGFLREAESLVALGMILLLLAFEFSRRYVTEKRRTLFVVGFIGISAVGVLALSGLGFLTLPADKFRSVLDPFYRSSIPLVQSVSEHIFSTWSSYYWDFGILVLLAPIGVLFAIRRPSINNLFLLIFFFSTLYFSSNLIRLAIILAPAVCLLGSYSMVELITPFIEIARQAPFSKRRVRYAKRVGRGFGVALIIVLLVFSSYTLMRGAESGSVPTTIAASSLPVKANVPDWTEALLWMKHNLPPTSVVASWWDYGYWMTIIGNQTTLADNGTINSTQIEQIGRMFMSNESEALKILKTYNATHVVVFTTLGIAYNGIQNDNYPMLYGDEVKWGWMASIPRLNVTALMDSSITTSLGLNEYMVNQLPKNDTVLTKLMVYGCQSYGGFPSASSLGITLENFGLAFASSNRMVFVYRVFYPDE